MTITFTELAELTHPLFRNIQGAISGFNEFDDLTTDPKAKAYAHRLANNLESNINTDELQYHAIDFIFTQKSWLPSRFSTGAYPVWYGSLNLTVGFYETIYHWQQTYLEAPQGFLATKSIIRTTRRVFSVTCNATLIDLRAKSNQHKELIHPDPSHYAYTQQIGHKIHQQGYPGLITNSARVKEGENAAIFRKEVLVSPKHYNDYIYEYDILQKRTCVKDLGTGQIILTSTQTTP